MTQEEFKSKRAVGLRSTNEYLVSLRTKIDSLKGRVRLSAYSWSDSQQDKILIYFMNRAIQIGEACFRVSDLGTPLFVLTRVLCEDLFLMFWVSQSEQNAAEYAKAPLSQLTKMAVVSLKKKVAKIRRIGTGEDVTESVLPQFDELIENSKRIEKIAAESGLGKVYDLIYRFYSLEVHGNTFEMPLSVDADGVSSTLCAIGALLNAMIFVIDNRNRTVVAEEVLRVLGLEKLGSK